MIGSGRCGHLSGLLAHGVNERVLVCEYAKSIGFFYQLLENAQGL